MTTDNKNVFVGAPDKVTGAIKTAPTTATAISSVSSPQTGFVDSGYISDAGLTVTPSDTITDIKDWSGATVRSILENFNGTLEWTHLETNPESAKNYFGDTNVAVTAATALHGVQMAAKLNGAERPHKSWAFNILDGERKVVIYCPDGVITSRGPIAFTKSGAVMWQVTMTAYEDATGTPIYIFTDNGVKDD